MFIQSRCRTFMRLPKESVDQAGRAERKRISYGVSKDVYACEDERSAAPSEMSRNGKCGSVVSVWQDCF